MRLIGHLAHENAARRFSSFLERKGIENRCEALFDAQTEQFSYEIWVVNEDRLQEAAGLLKEFEQHPEQSSYDIPVKEVLEGQQLAPVRRKPTPISTFFLFLCVFIFAMGLMQELPLRKEGVNESTLLLPPIESALLIDLPAPIEELEQWIGQQPPENLESALRAKLKTLETIPWWQGIYEWSLLKAKTGDGSEALGPLFTKVRQGEVWRLFTPALLHGGILHILFNMIWLWILSRPIEERIGSLRLLGLTLFLGVSTNVLQYLASGPFFLGYSGILAGLAGFIWVRERKAPWEGYPVQRMTLIFLAIFVLSMLLLQTVSFLVQIFTQIPFVLAIANTGHISGALLGFLLGRSAAFSRQRGLA